MSRYDHKIETSLEGIEHLSKEKKFYSKIIPRFQQGAQDVIPNMIQSLRLMNAFPRDRFQLETL